MEVEAISKLIDSELSKARQIKEARNAERIRLLVDLLKEAVAAKDIAEGICVSLRDDDVLKVYPDRSLLLTCKKTGKSYPYSKKRAKAALLASNSTELAEFFDAVLEAIPNEVHSSFISQ